MNMNPPISGHLLRDCFWKLFCGLSNEVLLSDKKIEHSMPYQHKWSNNCNWLCRGKNALFTHAIVVKTRCTGKLLQGDMC